MAQKKGETKVAIQRKAQVKKVAKKTARAKRGKTSGGRKVVLEQWVEVRIRNGKTVTELTPGNAELAERGMKMDPRPELVYRRLNFPEGVPVEYEWTGPDENMRRYGGGGVQRMTFEMWLALKDREEASLGGHINGTGKGNLPRPKEHGGCECAVCRANDWMLGA